jgi:hypothetical protein
MKMPLRAVAFSLSRATMQAGMPVPMRYTRNLLIFRPAPGVTRTRNLLIRSHGYRAGPNRRFWYRIGARFSHGGGTERR